MSQERKQFELQFHPLYKIYHAKKSGFKERESILIGPNQAALNKIAIFRGEDFIKFTDSNFDQILASLPQDAKVQNSAALGKYLIDNALIVKMDRHPEDQSKKKWPRKSMFLNDKKFITEGFYTWNIKVNNKMNHIKMGIILFLVFMVFLYPVWPFSFKFAVFKLTLYLCIFFCVLLVVRLVAYIISRMFGYSFWIFPNLNDDSNGLLGSFKPLYSIYRFSDGKLEIFLRIIAILGLIGLMIFIIQEPQYLSGFQEASEVAVDDILEWGKSKLEGNKEPLHRRAIPDLSDIMKEEEEEQLKNMQNMQNNSNDL